MFTQFISAFLLIIIQKWPLIVVLQMRCPANWVDLAAQGAVCDVDGHIRVEQVAVGEHHDTAAVLRIDDHHALIIERLSPLP